MGKQNKKRKTKKLLPLIFWGLIISLPFILFAINGPEEEIRIDLSRPSPEWQASPEGNPRYIILPNLRVDADWYDVCELEMKPSAAYDELKIFFLSPFNQNFDQNYSFDLDSGRAGRFNRITTNLTRHGAWQGMVRGALIFPGSNPKNTVFKNIRFIHANYWTKTKAFWSDFVKYADPKLGTCFAMASPIFAGKPFNPFFIPILWSLLAVGGVIIGGVHFFKADRRIAAVAAGFLLVAVVGAWAILDLRNDVVHLKSIARNISLYWGKSILEKRGIAVGEPEFINFMHFCDENIPLDARIFSQIPSEVPGTPPEYLRSVQYGANLRPRFQGKPVGSYFIFYRPEVKATQEIVQAQAVNNQQLNLAPGEELFQEISIWRFPKFLSRIDLWIKENDSHRGKVEVTLVRADKNTIVGRGVYLSNEGEKTNYRFSLEKDYNDVRVYLRIVNNGNAAVSLGSVYGDQYKEGGLSLAGRKIYGDLAFRLIFSPKGLVLFKRFNDEAYILLDGADK